MQNSHLTSDTVIGVSEQEQEAKKRRRRSRRRRRKRRRRRGAKTTIEIKQEKKRWKIET